MCTDTKWERDLCESLWCRGQFVTREGNVGLSVALGESHLARSTTVPHPLYTKVLH